ncbi:PcfJ domain-containing protein [Clostridium disporicum]|uniref:PcfJ domain-containing protein n=1 Tax=Clostridium disporicum TaxID=84024 RepID=UPI0034A1C83A
MKFIYEDDLNVILELPFNKQAVLGKVSFDIATINTVSKIPYLYMKKIGFEPINSKGITKLYRISHANESCISLEKCELVNGSGYCHERIDVSNEEFVNPNILLDGYKFLTSTSVKNGVLAKKYEIKYLMSNEFKVDMVEEFLLTMDNKNLIIKRDEDVVSLNKFKELMFDVFGGIQDVVSMIIPMIYDAYVDVKGFLDVYKVFKDFISKYPYVSNIELFEYYYYVGQLDFFYLFEYLFKNQLMNKIKDYHPMYSGNPIPKPTDIKCLSKFSREFKEKYYLRDDEILYEIEANPKFGVHGLKIVDEYLDVMKNINCSYQNPLYLSRIDRLLEGLTKILNTFDIALKVLMNRLVKVIFTECTDMMEYVTIIEDTLEMAETLNIDLGDKLPKDIDRLHDLFSEQLEYIQNLALEEAFSEQVVKNKKLLELLPTSDRFMVISPNNPNDLVNEGLKLNHCVGSYIKRYSNGYSKIFFIRIKTLLNEPFVTVEFNQYNELIQAKAKSNKNPSKEVMDYILKWSENLNGKLVEE